MATQSNQRKKKSSIFPDLPRGTPVIDQQGKFTDNWHLGLSSLFQGLQRNFTNEGIQIPQLSFQDISDIQAVYNPILIGKTLGTTPNISGKMVYDTTNAVPKVFIINFLTPEDPSSVITAARWWTFTIT